MRIFAALCSLLMLAACNAPAPASAPIGVPEALATAAHEYEEAQIAGDGETLSRLIADGIDLPILFISGQLDVPIPTSWPAGVPRSFLPKPFRNDELVESVRALPGEESELPGGHRFVVMAKSGSDPRAEIFKMATAKGLQLTELHRERASLEDVFRNLTAGSAR